MKFHHFLTVLVIALLASCGEDSGQQNKPFDHVFDFSRELESLLKQNLQVSKTIIQGGEAITAIEVPDWATELALFIEADFNTPKDKDNYLESSSEEGGIVSYVFEAKKGTKAKVQQAIYRFAGEQCVSVNMLVSNDNMLYNSMHELNYQPGSGYSIAHSQKVNKLFESTFKLTANFINTPRYWRALLNIGGEVLPFLFTVNDQMQIDHITIYNGAEQIVVKEVILEGDSVIIKLPIFDSEIHAKYYKDSVMIGYWYDNSRNSNYNIPFYGQYGINDRFANTKPAEIDVSGNWKVTFSPTKKDQWDAVAIFDQDDNHLSGTFLTETGDFRFLDGNVADKEMSLSCFDGAHAFLFKAEMDSANRLVGKFYSGSHWREAWIAERNDTFQLADPDSLTYLRNPDKAFTYSFPNLDSQYVSLNDERYKGKVVITQIMGSWCPNCMDETKELAQLYKKYNKEGLEIIALAFERAPTFKKAATNIHRLKKQFGATYEFLIAGSSAKDEAEKSLPMLNKISSYPTTVVTNRAGEVVKIHTGFFGPGTGVYYEHHMKETEELIKKLLFKPAQKNNS